MNAPRGTLYSPSARFACIHVLDDFNLDFFDNISHGDQVYLLERGCGSDCCDLERFIRLLRNEIMRIGNVQSGRVARYAIHTENEVNTIDSPIASRLHFYEFVFGPQHIYDLRTRYAVCVSWHIFRF